MSNNFFDNLTQEQIASLTKRDMRAIWRFWLDRELSLYSGKKESKTRRLIREEYRQIWRQMIDERDRVKEILRDQKLKDRIRYYAFWRRVGFSHNARISWLTAEQTYLTLADAVEAAGGCPSAKSWEWRIYGVKVYYNKGMTKVIDYKYI